VGRARGLWSAIVSSYRVRLAYIGSVERYRRAGFELLLGLTAIPLSIAVYSALTIMLHMDPLIALPLALSPGIPVWLLIADTVLSLREVRALVDNELPFFIVTAASASRTGLEPLELLRYLSRSRVFRGFRILGERFTALVEVVGLRESIESISRLAGRRARLFLAEYMSALSTGTSMEFLARSAGESIRDLSLGVSNSLSKRLELAVAVGLVAVVAPALTTGFTILLDPGFTLYATPLMLLLGALGALLVPGYPLPLSIRVEAGSARALRLLEILGLTTAVAPLVYSMVANTAPPGRLLLYSGLLTLALGAPGFTAVVRAILDAQRLSGVVGDSARHVRVYRSLHLYSNPLLEELKNRRVRAWLVDYVDEAVSFYRLLGDVDPDVYSVFTLFVNDAVRLLRSYLLNLVVVAAATLAAPLVARSLILLASPSMVTIQVTHVALIATGLVVSKLVIGSNTSTSLIGVLLTLYSM